MIMIVIDRDIMHACAHAISYGGGSHSWMARRPGRSRQPPALNRARAVARPTVGGAPRATVPRAPAARSVSSAAAADADYEGGDLGEARRVSY